MQVLLTGAKGFIGSHLLARLRASGLAAHVLEQDVTQPISSEIQADVVVHLAAISSESSFRRDPYLGYKTNVHGTLNILEYCRKTGARLVFTSTCGIYQPVKCDCLSEESVIDPQTTYAKSKALAESLCHSYASDFGVSCLILRLFNVYGMGQHEGFLVPYIVRQASEGREIVLKSADSVRDFVNVKDVARAIDILVKQSFQGCQVYNVGTGMPTAVCELVGMLEKIMGTELKCCRQRAENDPNPYTLASIAKISRDTSWKPLVSLEDGLRALLSPDAGRL